MGFLSGIASDLGDTLAGAVHTAGQAGNAWVQQKLNPSSSNATSNTSTSQSGGYQPGKAETIPAEPSPMPNSGQAAVQAQQAAANPFVKYRMEFLAVAGLLAAYLIVHKGG